MDTFLCVQQQEGGNGQQLQHKHCQCTTSVKGAGSMDKFVQPVTVMKGEKLDRANELLVNALTANLLPSALLDSPEFRDLLGFISSGTCGTTELFSS